MAVNSSETVVPTKNYAVTVWIGQFVAGLISESVRDASNRMVSFPLSATITYSLSSRLFELPIATDQFIG
jgi:hypothetical protein